MQHFVEVAAFNGLAHVVVEALAHESACIFLHRVGRHGHHRRTASSQQATDFGCGRDAVHLRHLNIHKNDIVGTFGRDGQGNGLGAVAGHVHVAAQLAEQALAHLLVDGIIVDEQHAGHGREGLKHGLPQ